MKIRFALLMTVIAFLVAGAGAQGMKVGVVNMARIEAEAPSVKSAVTALNAEFEPRNKQLAELQKKIAAGQARLKKEGDKMAASERQALERDLSNMIRQSNQSVVGLRDEYEMRRKEVLSKVVQDTRAAIHAVAEAGKYDLILQEAAFARPSVDITDDVLKEMARRGGR